MTTPAEKILMLNYVQLAAENSRSAIYSDPAIESKLGEIRIKLGLSHEEIIIQSAGLLLSKKE